jgi:hypothetical protein
MPSRSAGPPPREAAGGRSAPNVAGSMSDAVWFVGVSADLERGVPVAAGGAWLLGGLGGEGVPSPERAAWPPQRGSGGAATPARPADCPVTAPWSLPGRRPATACMSPLAALRRTPLLNPRRPWPRGGPSCRASRLSIGRPPPQGGGQPRLERPVQARQARGQHPCGYLMGTSASSPSLVLTPAGRSENSHLQGFLRSPLTDSNRRPPPYPWRLEASSAGHTIRASHLVLRGSKRVRILPRWVP